MSGLDKACNPWCAGLHALCPGSAAERRTSTTAAGASSLTQPHPLPRPPCSKDPLCESCDESADKCTMCRSYFSEVPGPEALVTRGAALLSGGAACSAAAAACTLRCPPLPPPCSSPSQQWVEDDFSVFMNKEGKCRACQRGCDQCRPDSSCKYCASGWVNVDGTCEK